MTVKIGLENLGTLNKNCVSIEKDGRIVRLYFSYQTLVAVDGVTAKNEWSKTTGKFLNELCPDKSSRVLYAEVLAEAEKRINAILYGSR